MRRRGQDEEKEGKMKRIEWGMAVILPTCWITPTPHVRLSLRAHGHLDLRSGHMGVPMMG